MVSNFHRHREPLHKVLMVLLFLAGLVSACSTSNTSGSSPTPTSAQGIRGIFHEYALPPSPFVPLDITAGPDGNLWFTEIMTDQNGSVQAGKIGRMTLTGKVSEFSLPFHQYPAGPNPTKEPAGSAQGEPLAITAGPDGNLWFTDFQYVVTGTTAGKIGRITTAGKISDFPLPTSSDSPTSITFGTDHTLWFIEVEITPTDPSGKNGKIGHLV